ncbi:MAG: N-6 DNA methylase [Deltaproteobacteria bacterium]|nr:N-6 DNA methylase [Deltaproteobacteria bacterium]MCL5792320.1 N-6 DNA methylase [Deltaproteobacteria bacterium]
MDNQLPQQVSELIERFERNQQSYTSSQYNEAQLRQEFINPFFEALGWDVSNEQGNAEAYKDVIHEDAIKIGSAIKAPDYCFRIGGTRKFFVEAKKPSIKIDDNIDAAFQLRRYAWSAKLPLGILTNFKEFAVYDCRIDPVKDDKASTARISYFIYKDYPQQWDYLVSVFSKESVLKGSFDKYAESSKLKRGTATVDEKFLKEIESWRSGLAHKIAIRNTKLTTRELNFAVQRTIDRIIFLRICEDRGMEQYGKLQSMMNGVNVYKRLFELFQRADQRYNSGLFHFSKERDREEEPDNLTPFLNIDDEPIKDIINRLYYPESPYEFSVLSADILGQVYEQFLGKVIRLTEGHHAKIEEKPEVRKAGGIYYTPTYIVDYIVKNSVGKLVEGKTPKQISKLRILDPACGSGSFLIGAFQYLLDWHLDWYVKDGAEKYAKAARPILYQAGGTHAGHGSGSYRLTTYERKRILLNNIYGVDIDPQAVEVTKLSLLLKVLEGENSQTLDVQFKLFHERALPDLENNIKCGNSLIGPDFYQQQSLNLFNDDERLRINAFDWNAEFKDIMTSGGFDAVIGNPPYGFHQIHGDNEKVYFKNHFIASQGSYEHYFLFYEASLRLLNNRGIHGFIVPVTWLTIPSALSLRKFILGKYSIDEIVWLPEFVFKDAKVNTLVSIISSNRQKDVHIKIYDSLGFQKIPREDFSIKQNNFIDAGYFIGIFERGLDSNLLKKITHASVPLDTLAKPCSGYNPYEVGKGERPKGGLQSKETVESKPYHSISKEGKLWKPEIIGRDLSRYSVQVTGKRWIKYGPWLAAPRDPDNFEGKRILVQEITGGKDRRIIAAYFEGELYHSRDVIPIKCDNSPVSPLYILGILNSELITWYHHKRSPKSQKALFPKVLVSDIAKLPIRSINLANPSDKSSHDKMVSLVDQMLSLNKQLPSAKTEHEKTALQRQIDTIDKQIDELVYELYGITEEERKIIEGG